MNSIKAKLTIVLLLMALIPLAILGIIIYNQTTGIFTSTIQEYLLAIAQSKDDALENYIVATEDIGHSLATTDAMQRYIELAGGDLSAEESAEFTAVTKQVNNLLFSVQEAHWGKYHHVFLIDATERIVISPNYGFAAQGSPSSHLGEDTSENEWAQNALRRGVTTVSDYSSWVESDHTHQMLFFPVKNSLGDTRAVLGFELQIPYEQEILTENVELGETGNIFLVTTDGVPIVYQGIENQTPLNTPAVIEAQRNGSSLGRRLNAEGVDVIEVYLGNADYPWVLVAEVEAQEAFRNLFSIQTTMWVGLLVTIIFIIILSILISNYIVNPIKELTEQMEQVSLGKLDVKVSNADRKDEIGQLVQAFNRIVTSLKIAMQGFVDR